MFERASSKLEILPQEVESKELVSGCVHDDVGHHGHREHSAN